MADNWIEEQRTELVKIYEECQIKKEPILEALSLYLFRILNGLVQMEGSDTYVYESQILGEAMRLFCIYYVEQVREVLGRQSHNGERDRIIEDLEEAISKISNVYKNVIDSTSNFDRQLFTNHAVETSIYDISPKLFATYSMVLETLVALFNQQNIYAFLLHPSLKSNVESVNLFDSRKRMGKVVLIYIPENKIKDVSQIPFFLLHETFHVLTREERCRKERACKMEVHMFTGISQRLFRNVSFDFVEKGADVEIKNKLMQRWFKTKEWIERLREEKDDDRIFYSRDVIARICKNWTVALQKIFITLGQDLCQVFADIDYQQKEENPYKALMQAEWEIQKNLMEILANSEVELYALAYMQIYREAYADIASILTAGISPDIYEKAFQESQTEPESSMLEKDVLRDIRIYIVAQTVAGCEGIAYAEEWKNYRDKFDPQKQSEHMDSEETADAIRSQNQYEKLWIQSTDLDIFKCILEESAKKLWKKLGNENSFSQQFREILKEMNMINILNGKVNRELIKLKGLVKAEAGERGKA